MYLFPKYGTKILVPRSGTKILARPGMARHGNIWHGTDPQGTARKYLARHGSTRSGHGTARDVPAEMAQNGARRICFLLIQTLPTFLATQILIVIMFSFWILWIPNFWISKSPYLQISKFPDFQTPPAPANELSHPNLTPLPTHPGIKCVARSLCCDQDVWYQ